MKKILYTVMWKIYTRNKKMQYRRITTDKYFILIIFKQSNRIYYLKLCCCKAKGEFDKS